MAMFPLAVQYDRFMGPKRRQSRRRGNRVLLGLMFLALVGGSIAVMAVAPAPVTTIGQTW